MKFVLVVRGELNRSAVSAGQAGDLGRLFVHLEHAPRVMGDAYPRLGERFPSGFLGGEEPPERVKGLGGSGNELVLGRGQVAGEPVGVGSAVAAEMLTTERVSEVDDVVSRESAHGASR